MMTIDDTTGMRTLVDQFAHNIIEQKNSSSSKAGNRYAMRALMMFKQLVDNYGDRGRQELATLFTHEEDRVRCMAAAFLLRFANREAMRVLKEIAFGRGCESFAAEQAIKRWEEGNWELDP